MEELNNLHAVLKLLSEALNGTNIQTESQNLAKAVATYQTNQIVGLQLANTAIDNLNGSLSAIRLPILSAIQEETLNKLGFDNLIGPKASVYFSDIKAQLINSPKNALNVLNALNAEVTKIKTQPSQFLRLLKPFSKEESLVEFKSDEGIIEIIFDGGVAIDDFGEAKEQMNDWFVIIDGYARLLGARREDFEIIGISKNSPSKFKIKTTLKYATLIVGVIFTITQIEKNILENKLLIEKLKQAPLVSDSAFHKEYIEKASAEIEKNVKSGIEKMVNEKMEEYSIGEGNGDVKNSFSKSVEYQYNFLTDGGDVNFYVNNGDIQQKVDTLQQAKTELKQIRDNYDNQKSLNSGIDSTAIN